MLGKLLKDVVLSNIGRNEVDEDILIEIFLHILSDQCEFMTLVSSDLVLLATNVLVNYQEVTSKLFLVQLS